MMRPLALSALLSLALAAPAAAAPAARTLCVYDPSGAAGDAFNFMKDFRTAAVAWGVDFTLKPYTDEKIAAEDFKAGKCHAALLTGVRARAFVPFAGSVEAMGAVPTYDQLETVVRQLAQPKAGQLLRKGDYEAAAIFPAGAVYLFTRNRNLKSVGDLAGKRIATLDFDEAAKVMVRLVGASMVAADIGTFAGMFNNGGVELCYAPATAFQPLELAKGLGAKGGILRYTLAQLTLQLLVRAADLPAGFGDQARAHAAQGFRRTLRVVEAAEKKVPAKYWVEVPAADLAKYDAMLRDVRIRLRDQEKVFDAGMLKLLRKVRCKADASRAECAEQKE